MKLHCPSLSVKFSGLFAGSSVGPSAFDMTKKVLGFPFHMLSSTSSFLGSGLGAPFAFLDFLIGLASASASRSGNYSSVTNNLPLSGMNSFDAIIAPKSDFSILNDDAGAACAGFAYCTGAAYCGGA